MERSLRLAFILGAQAALPVAVVLLPVERAVTSAIQSEFDLHDFLHVVEIARAGPLRLESSRGVWAEFARILKVRRVLLANALAIRAKRDGNFALSY
jgi:hypothetical protein